MKNLAVKMLKKKNLAARKEKRMKNLVQSLNQELKKEKLSQQCNSRKFEKVSKKYFFRGSFISNFTDIFISR